MSSLKSLSDVNTSFCRRIYRLPFQATHQIKTYSVSFFMPEFFPEIYLPASSEAKIKGSN
ncbi:hypothetical protein DU80_04230 [Methanosarcina mazei]|uniref:Uncharacterized protein n=1 Tax=Methanosarcina mazei TaxID=2209 RepID=A0A0F8BW44_METMZ|nr:hypothetical protein DU47_10170 [Methanosarcina mazei]KKG30617.1 hypothetical protein DU52_06630 [Methanosarcina mazei]KKG79095.1 hypothetical protein DU43_17235 [Methanosarcina mazei]KKH32654.1 hypothetical protein DU37_10055 [Methanosarcina mazei]KKH79497.1 hypothetical protein DU80_04230 [Methanosarcina mazei]